MNVEQRLQRRFRKALRDYRLIDDGDKILVGLSGGKDSLCLLQLLARQSKVFRPRFTIIALHVRMENIQYECDTTYLQQFCDELGVSLHFVTTHFEDAPNDNHKKKPACFLCSWQRRKQLFNIAQELGCNKIALGHHQDDIIHTALMNLTFQGQFSSMPALLKMDKMPLSIIRPLCLCEEEDIKEYAKQQGFKKLKKLCPYEKETNRTNVHELFERMQKLNAEARYSIWNAIESAMKMRPVVLLLLLMVVMSGMAQHRKRIVKEEPLTEEEIRLQQMTMTTQRIVFVDSIVLPKYEFLQAYHLTPEAGQIAPYSTFFPNNPSDVISFMNAIGNRCLYADNGSTIYSQEKLQQQWTSVDTLTGINNEHQLQEICYPFMMPDGMTIYFSAKGEESIGGYDIFMSTYDATEERFLQPENIGMPFNSTANDYLFAIDEYNRLGFFATDRNQPFDTVCVYTFIPPEKYQTYDASLYTPEQIAAFARIDEIGLTHDNKQEYREALERLRQARSMSKNADTSFDFVINNQTIYHQLQDFKAAGNQERYKELSRLHQRYDFTLQALEKARNNYVKASEKERIVLGSEIMGNEQVQHMLYQDIHQLEKLIRLEENTYLNKKK